MARVMFIGAHPDDIEIGAGGVIAQLIEQGHQITAVDLTDGEPTPNGTREIREVETARANEILGITDRVCLEEPNRILQDTPEARTKLAIEMRRTRPEIIFTHSEQDVHPDHVATFAITRGAILLSRIHKIDLPHQPWRPGKVFYYFSYHLRQIYTPSIIVRLTPEHYRKKIDSILAYESQFVLNQTNSGIEELVERRLRESGRLVYADFGEPFASEEPIGVNNAEDIF